MLTTRLGRAMSTRVTRPMCVMTQGLPISIRWASGLPARTPERTAELERLAEEHNGFLFGEIPLPEGQSREWEDWEYIYPPMMGGGFFLYFVLYSCRPYYDMDEWARAEALKRLAANEVEGGDENEDEDEDE
eukprot:CAMPEP_0119317174 /NCGR_PEP_ID=MMETSP1333-20130426/42248_1 /TAXON_ID=418940 /ORGANISM="Scyphosphaera apsteinii, Strain RCC1455" /LENGTH=131 /DNA_ID=CAMNT_0007323037 /DNA_START=33 /DNA_END=428 /DNA_ORIENTATION=+